MFSEWSNIISDLQVFRQFCIDRPVLSFFGVLLFLGYIFFLIHFLLGEKVIPTSRGGIPVESFYLRLLILGALIYLVLSMTFRNSILLKAIFTVPVLFLGWLTYKDYD